MPLKIRKVFPGKGGTQTIVGQAADREQLLVVFLLEGFGQLGVSFIGGAHSFARHLSVWGSEWQEQRKVLCEQLRWLEDHADEADVQQAIPCGFQNFRHLGYLPGMKLHDPNIVVRLGFDSFLELWDKKVMCRLHVGQQAHRVARTRS